MDLDGENPELRGLATHFAEAGGALWAVEVAGTIVGMVAVKPMTTGPDGAAWELCRLYVAAAQRGTGVAARLMRVAEAHARASGAAILDLWTDTRFDRAHRFYERHGFVRDGGIRALNDVSNSLEFGYAKPVTGVVVRSLDTAAAASAARGLGRILQDCAADGSAMGFLPSLSLEQAQAFYREAAKSIAAGQGCLLVAWAEGRLVGSVLVNLDRPTDQLHQAEIHALLVAPDARGQGGEAALLQRAEVVAQGAGRLLLTLQTRAGDPLDHLCCANGWIQAGQLPGAIRRADGSFSDAALLYKAL